MNNGCCKALFAATVTMLLVLVGCSSAEDSSERLQASDIRPALRGLPFPHRLWAVKPPNGDDAAFRGVARGKYGATLHFSIVVGVTPRTIAIPNTRLQDPTGEGEAGIAFDDDISDARKFSTVRQWHAASHMSTEIQEALCKKATGEPCPV